MALFIVSDLDRLWYL